MCVKKQNGFTLVEIMIVVAIIGLLASIGTLAIMKSVNNARIKTAESELEILSLAVLQMAWDTGMWPNRDARTVTGGGAKVMDISDSEAGLMYGSTNSVYGDDWKGPYYEGSLVDPWENPYFFDPSHSEGVVVGSYGLDGVPGGIDITVRLDE